MWLATGAALAAGSAGLFAWAVRGRRAQVFAPSIWQLPAGRRRIALTFDDGPSESTPALLEILKAHNARATFFLCGQNAERLPEIVRQIAREGHEIGNHTWSHPRLDFRSPARMRDEIGRTQELLQSLTGQTPRLFRAPYGVRWFGLGQVQREFGLLGVMWTSIGLDWKLAGPAISQRLLRQASDGAILCLHDGRVLTPNPDITATTAAVSLLLPALQTRNLSPSSISAMLEP